MKVRIAVVADKDGNWSSIGWSGATDEEKMSIALEGLDTPEVVQCFVEAEIPEMTIPTIQGEIK